MKNILLLGSEAVEHVIKEKLQPNNVHFLSTDVFEDIKNFCISNKIELVIPCQVNYLCNGIVNYLKIELPDTKVFGPNKNQSKIEGSKYYAKNLMWFLKIPTAPFTYHREYDFEFDHLYDCVIKYSGLANGKGVFLPNNEMEAFNAIKQLTSKFKNNWEGVIVEECLYGIEVSVLAFCNGKKAFLMPQVQDYKNLLDNDYGPNTGGMGAIAPVNILTYNEIIEVQEHLNNVVKTLSYKGILYAGIMKTEDGYFFLEFNCRFGDPEAQVILNLLDTPLLNIINQCLNKEEVILKWKEECAATIVLSHDLYPESKLEEPTKIEINNMPNEIKIYNSSVEDDNLTYGGRVMSLVSLGSCIPHALQLIYNNIHRVNYNGIYYRRDIGSNYYSDNVIPNVGVLTSGNGTCLETVLQNTNSIKIIITNNKKAGVIEKCKKYKVPFFYLDASFCSKDEYYEKVVNIMRLFNVKLVLLAGYTKIVPKILFNDFHTINIHPGLLPKYKGLQDLNIHGAVLKNKDTYTGCSLHEVVEEVDAGWILLQKQMMVKTESIFTLKMQVQELEKMCIYEYICNYPIEH